ncbi:S16 family serine protease [Clostridium sp. 19966]|uniref:S16 family serine protease n=1 Tax=Clostridium sp. 19966 TaxID=2768166 RepID=UPI0028EA7398|nr:S16 family serine protease [Clostridium sp. 19966]
MDTIPEPLLNRMEVIRFPGYTEIEKFHIARKHLIPTEMDKTGLTTEDLDITDEVLNTVIRNYTMEAGVRGLKRQIDKLCRSAAVMKVRDKKSNIVVEVENVTDFITDRPIHHDEILEEKRAGIVTGLAWTAAGGEILFIETILTKGSGKIQITRQLGDVMKESVQIAVSLAKSMYPDKAQLFEKNDLHIHVPEGATPKDGPSAGITITTAIVSLLTGKAVSPEYGMTGEVSLRGKVMPIGGLPEKLMAAKRAGLTKVLIPDANQDDLKEVTEEVKESLQVIPVKTVDEVIKLVLNEK